MKQQAHRSWRVLTLAAFLCLTQAAETPGGRSTQVPSLCDVDHRPWLLDQNANARAAFFAPAQRSAGEMPSGAPASVSLGSATSTEPVATTASAEPELRVVTYNIHSGLGQSHALRRAREEVENNLRTIAADIVSSTGAHEPADIVALNEVDFDSQRSAGIDEAAFLAEELAQRTGHHYEIVRGETWRRSLPGLRVRFGNALLTRLPLVSASACLLTDDDSCDGAARVDGLPSLRVGGIAGFFSERRGVVKATVRSGSRLVDVLVTHLDPFLASVREAQALHLLRRFVDPGRTTLLLGDLNAVSTPLTTARRFFATDRTLDILTSASLSDARVTYASAHGLPSLNQWPTYPAAEPLWPLDAVLASADLAPRTIEVIGETASDHRGLMTRLAAVDGQMLALQQARLDAIRATQLDRILHCDVVAADHRRATLLDLTGFGAMVQAREQVRAAAFPVAQLGDADYAGPMGSVPPASGAAKSAGHPSMAAAAHAPARTNQTPAM
ncbi:MAG TPA: endonuclease/exonuclease/phosphatase family protein [Candidatus Binatia bacterium]|nr:endonuclease/exonuclease/phosphatase family protein [Candidatus Binatia bacterium]